MSRTASQLYGQPWRKRDFVIALNAYIENRGAPTHIGAPWIVAVARILGRTPASVLMRMANFASLDPSLPAEREGLARGGPLCERVFREWYGKPNELAATARFLIDEENTNAHDRYDLFNPEPVRLPHAFGKYELLDAVGSGGFGSVFSCLPADRVEMRAIKVIKLELVNDKEVLHRFYREIRALKSLNDPTIIGIYEDNLESEEEYPAFVMDLARSNLRDYVAERTRGQRDPEERPLLGADEATSIMLRMCQAIQVLHEHRPMIIHRDLNPSNILLLPDGRWVLADFGLAKFLHTAPLLTAFETRATQTGMGTAYYAAPEQYRDFSSCRAFTDVYALGILLWDLFSVNWPQPDRSDTGLPADLDPVFLKASHRNPKMRYRDVVEFRDAFIRAIQSTWPWAIPTEDPST